jgi:hypothetical protein
LKAEIKVRPHIFIPILFLVSIMSAAFILRAAEMPIDEVDG